MQRAFHSLFLRIDNASPWVLGLILATLSFLQYNNTLDHDHVLDDLIVVTENPKVKDGLVEVGAYFEQAESQMVEDQYGYRPLTLISLALDIELLGKGAENGHLMNVLYFSLLVLIVFFFLRQLFPQTRQLLPFLVALLFLVHPIHVEAVANIKSRDEILALTFGLLGLMAYLKWVRTPKQWYWAVAGLVSLGSAFLCKENAMTYLALVPLVVLVQPGLSMRFKALASAMLPVLAGGLIAVLALQGQANTVDNMGLTEGTGIFMEDPIMGNAIFQQHQPPERFATGTGILLRYWKNFLVPYPLVYYSGYNQIPLTNFGDPLVIISLIFHLGLLALMVLSFRRHPILFFAIGYYFVTISIYSHFVRPLSDAMADRFLLSPSLGMSMILVYGLMALLKVDRKKKATEKPLQPVLALGMAGLLITFSALTYSRNQAWKDNLTLFSTDVVHLEDCARCHFHYAQALGTTYDQSPNKQELQREIILHFRRAIEITDRAYNSYIVLGKMYYSLGMTVQGNQIFEDAVKYYPDQARPWFELGLGKYQQQKWQEAVPALSKAGELAPNREDIFFYLAWAEFRSGNPSRGIELMRQLQQQAPDKVLFPESLTEMYLQTGNRLEGDRFASMTLQFKPNNQQLLQKLAQLYSQLGDTALANDYMRQVRDLARPR